MCFQTFMTLGSVLINNVIANANGIANVGVINLFIFIDLVICSLCLKVLYF